MIKIKVSYEKEEELLKIKRLLLPYTKSFKLSQNSDGKFKKAYIIIKNKGDK